MRSLISIAIIVCSYSDGEAQQVKVLEPGDWYRANQTTIVMDTTAYGELYYYKQLFPAIKRQSELLSMQFNSLKKSIDSKAVRARREDRKKARVVVWKTVAIGLSGFLFIKAISPR